MKISAEIASASRILGEERAIEALAKAGFDAWDFSMFKMAPFDWGKGEVIKNDHPLQSNNYLAFARKLKQIGLDNGIVCNQSHAPFPSNVPAIYSVLKRAIECTAEAGGSICIIHPDNNATPEKNAEMYNELLPFAKGCGVKIATENMFNWDKERDCACFAACATPQSFVDHLNAVNDPFLVACLDIGHAEITSLNTSAKDMIHALKGNLQALHIHDNNKLWDQHQIPFSGKIDFCEVVKALKEIGYNGYLTLEADAHLRNHTAENVMDGINELASAAMRLREMF